MRFKGIGLLFCILLLILIFIVNKISSPRPDLSIVGPVLFSDGIGRQTILLIDALKDQLSIQCISTREKNLTDIPSSVKKIINKKKCGSGKVAIYESPLFKEKIIKKFLPKHAKIKIAHSMFETTELPKNWVKHINKYFDAVVVPDEFLISVYEGSGVKKPIFVLPLGIYLDEFYQQPIKEKPNSPFVFGNLAGICDRKNPLILIEAFYRAFGNNEKVKLVLNSRLCNEYFDPMPALNKIKELGLTNVALSYGALHWKDYVKLMATFDCYVYPSKGEGFSISPREALALGIPVIVTDNTAQDTICQSGCVEVVTSNILEPAFSIETKENQGCFFNCTIDDLAVAMKNVYENYEAHLKKAHRGRDWTQQYRFQNLKEKYLALVKPKHVKLSMKNLITDDGCLETTSNDLYLKYLSLIAD